MRKALIILSLPILVVLLGFTLVALLPTGYAHAAPATDSAPLPMCTHEDGSGQALCTWDAQTQGNGMGTDVVAGDCSLGTVHTVGASNACLTLWDMDVRISYSEDGSISEAAKGSVLVADCLDIEYEATISEWVRNSLNNEGWNLEECFKAHIVG